MDELENERTAGNDALTTGKEISADDTVDVLLNGRIYSMRKGRTSIRFENA